MADAGAAQPAPRRPRPRGIGAALGAALALLLVFAAVRLTTTAPPPSAERDADPSRADLALFDLPPRGSLADDADWLTGVAGLATLAELPAERAVPFAGDVPAQRLALVLGRDGTRTTAAWLTGPPGASPEQMALAVAPYPVGASEPLALWDVPDPARTDGLLVVIARPGADAAFLPGRFVDVGGQESPVRYPLTLLHGVATTPVAAPVGTPSASLVVQHGTDGDAAVLPVLSDRAQRVADAPVAHDDPRGLRSSVDERQLQDVLHEMLGTYALPPRRLSPVLLAAGPVGEAGDRAVLVGATLPSGATVAWLSVAGGGPGRPLTRTVSTAPAPAGTVLLDRVLAVPAGWAVSRIPLPQRDAPPGWLVISGPRGGTTAEALSAAERTLATLPLVDGAGVGPVPQDTAAVRILGASGEPLSGAGVARLAG